ncbi:MAG: hypothetical protein IJ193_01420, partial [Bacilli bacterium]|nr:hypothetical protein [Bacilli bacterium]
MEKITLEQFNNLKKKLYDSRNNLNEYMAIEEEIVSFDLSDIPYEAWNGMRIIGSIDFSNTNANLDFRHVQFRNLCNFDSCNLRNIPVPELPLPWQEKCRNRELTYSDIIENINIFEGIPVRYYLKEDNEIPNLSKIVGNHLISDLIKEHIDVFSHILQRGKLEELNERINTNLPFEESFLKAVKNYARNAEFVKVRFYDENHNEIYQLPDWLESMNLKVVPNYLTMEEIENHNIQNYIFKDGVEEFLDIMNIDYLKRFEEENHILLKKTFDRMPYSNYLEIFGNYIYVHTKEEERNYIKNHQNNYEEFCDNMANLLVEMRIRNYFSDYPAYDFLDGDFRDKHPEAFIEKDAPEMIKKVFYKNQLTPSYIQQHHEVMSYLMDKDLLKLVKVHVSDRYSPKESENYHVSFAHNIVRKFGNNELLMIYAKYGDRADRLENIDSIQTVDELENAIHDYFYDQIVNHSYKYDELKKDKEFVAKHSSLFIDLTNVEGIPEKDKEFIERSFHDRYLSFEIIRKYPQLVNIFMNKDLSYAFGANGLYRGNNHVNYLFRENPYYEKEEQQDIQKIVSKEDFLRFCVRYGRFLENRKPILNPEQKSAFEIQQELDQQIIDNCRSGKINYFPQEVPDFVKEQQDLFLSEDAPEDLYKKFYSTINDLMTFRDLHAHPEWMPYLEGKSISTALIRSSYKKDEMVKYLNIFGNDKGVKFGIQKPDTVEKMINSGEVDLMKQWYDKTKQKFIPDIVIMHNFSLEDSDKFLRNGSIWSNLMRIKNYTADEESREALLKLAYTFGAFDNDNSGYKKAVELFTGLPRVIKRENASTIQNLGRVEVRQELLHDHIELAPASIRNYLKLKNTLIEEGFQLDESKSVTENIYALQEDGSYKLMINPQNYPKSASAIRTMMEKDVSAPVLSPAKAHQLFGGFELKYDKDFREFFLNNFDKILEDDDSPAFLSSIQKQFQDIKVANSNRHLTWDLAVSYVQSNRYENVEVGNEKAAEVSAIAGYTQEEFDVLQQIYNYGKTRIFHSIPRVKNQVGNYQYEVLKLNDPLAMAIGTLTDCCQEIGNAAEMCMEHSMVSNSGRIFIIKDEDNNIVAQSWLWRNKDTICFDNIEIPDRAFTRKVRDGLKRE